MIDIVENAQRLSNQSDRVAFFALGILGILAGLLAIRYLAAKDEANAAQNREMAKELRDVVQNNTIQVQLCKDALNRNTQALEVFEHTAVGALESRRMNH